jgi:nucleoid-associated protein YgaU
MGAVTQATPPRATRVPSCASAGFDWILAPEHYEGFKAQPEDAMATEPTNITPAGKTYTVVKGDSLSKIAKREYGDASKWRQIYQANRDVIDNPDLIEPGQDLIIPEQ